MTTLELAVFVIAAAGFLYWGYTSIDNFPECPECKMWNTPDEKRCWNCGGKLDA